MNYAVFIGANGNKKTGILNFAENDAKLINGCFINHGYETTIITDTSIHNKYYILEQINKCLDKCKAKDTIIFFFAGHGKIDNGQLFLALNNSDFDHINNTYINISEISSSFTHSSATNKLIILDCCHAGAIVNDVKFSIHENFSILLATEVLERAIELNEHINSGIFSYYLNKALTTNFFELTNTNFEITLHNLHKYITSEIESNHHGIPIPHIIQKQRSDFIIAKLSSSTHYIDTLLTNKKYLDLDKVYVELFGQQEELIETLAIEKTSDDTYLSILDNFDTFSNYSTQQQDFNTEVKKEIKNSVVKITDLAYSKNKFILTGAPGSGKSTTLLKILLLDAQKIKTSENSSYVPVFISAHEITEKHGFIQLISKKLEATNIDKILKKGGLRIIIDGLNEIDFSLKDRALQELKSILCEKKYDLNSFVISSRKHGFKNIFNLPVYELKDLNENDVIKYIENYSPLYSKVIWENLHNSYQIRSLIYNPLYLKMIVLFATSEEGRLPSNRGQLYQKFTTLILKREEERKKQTFIETKIDVLSFLAYNIRLTGKSKSISKERAKDIVLIKLKELNESISVHTFLDELFDNYLVASQNEDFTFLHETYLEYFAAIEIKKKFLLNGYLELNVIDDNWLEPLLISAELFTDEVKRLEYFDYLFIGKKYEKKIKKINEITSEDLNHNLTLACRIAYNLKEIHPIIFERAEIYLKNYLAIWYFKHGQNISIIALENIFAGISALSSEYLFKKIFMDIKWSYIWLYAEKIELESFLLKPAEAEVNYFEKTVKPYYYSLSNAILSNLSDYKLLFNLLSEIEISHYYFYSFSIKNGIKNLKNNFFKFNPETVLKQLFKEDNTLDKQLILNEIGKRDLDFYIDNIDFLEIDKQQVVEYILINHKYNTKAIVIIFEFLNKYQINNKVLKSIINELISNYNNYDLCLKYLINFFTALSTQMGFRELDSEIYLFKILHKVPFYSLPISVQNWFEKHNTILNDTIDLQNLISKLIPEKQNFNFQLSYFDIIEFKDKIGFVVDIDNLNIIRKKNLFLIQNNEVFNVFVAAEFRNNRNLSFKESKNLTLLIKKETNLMPPKTGVLFLKVYEESKTDEIIQYIHPQILIESIFSIENCNFIRNSSLKNNFNFSNINLTFLFHDILDNVNYCLITNIITNTVFVYSIMEKRHFTVWVHTDNLNQYSISQIVTYEKNDTLGIIYHKLEVDKIGFVQSEVVKINEFEKFGFIKKTNDHRDYFFHFDECNFPPNLNDKVRFIPATSNSTTNFDKPIALKISKIEDVKKIFCKITYCKVEDKKIFGYAKDLETNIDLSFSLNTHHLLKIKNLKNSIQRNQVFQYNFKKQNHDGNSKIFLLEYKYDIFCKKQEKPKKLYTKL